MNTNIAIIIGVLLAVILLVAGFGLIQFAVDIGDEAVENTTGDDSALDIDTSDFSSNIHRLPQLEVYFGGASLGTRS